MMMTIICLVNFRTHPVCELYFRCLRSCGRGTFVLFCDMEPTWKLTPSRVEHSLSSSRRSVVVRYITETDLL